MNINDFVYPMRHPYDMLRGYKNAYEKESVLAFCLSECHEKNNIHAPIRTNHKHPTMIDDDLLTEEIDGRYKLTTKAIELLYTIYGKDNDKQT